MVRLKPRLSLARDPCVSPGGKGRSIPSAGKSAFSFVISLIIIFSSLPPSAWAPVRELCFYKSCPTTGMKQGWVFQGFPSTKWGGGQKYQDPPVCKTRADLKKSTEVMLLYFLTKWVPREGWSKGMGHVCSFLGSEFQWLNHLFLIADCQAECTASAITTLHVCWPELFQKVLGEFGGWLGERVTW